MRTRQRIASFMAFALFLPSVVGAVNPSTFGFRPSELNDMKRNGANPADVRALLAGIDSYIVQLARRKRVPEPALRGSLTQKIIRAPAADRTYEKALALAEASAKQIEAITAENKELRTQIVQNSDARLPNPALIALAEAQKAINEGRLDDAATSLAALEPLRLSDATDAYLAWEKVVSARAGVALLQGDYDGVVLIAGDADANAQIQMQRLAASRWKFRMIKADALYAKGETLGYNSILSNAVQVYRDEALPMAPRSERASDWATTQNGLGVALFALGKGTNDVRQIEASVEALRAALSERTRTPHLWAETQYNLGLALAALGGGKNDKSFVVKAVTALSEALAVQSESNLTLEAARTRNARGLARTGLATFDTKPSSAVLELAAQDFNEAIPVFMRSEEPLWRAKAQCNLGIALFTKAGEEGSISQLADAATAFENSRDVIRRGSTPTEWKRCSIPYNYVAILLADRLHDATLLNAAEKELLETGILTRGDVQHEQFRNYIDALLTKIFEIRIKWKAEPKK